MVVLVRCMDDTVALALESRLDDLKKEGLISAVLCKDRWVGVEGKTRSSSNLLRRRNRITATVASCCTPF